MILAPDRRIVTPSRRIAPFWRNPLARRPARQHRPYCPLYNMADGDISLDASGNRILDASGNVYLKCCCAGTIYVRAKRCADGVYADICVVKGSVTLPYYFKTGSYCYVVAAGNTESATPWATIQSAGSAITGCADTNCNPCTAVCAVVNPLTVVIAGVIKQGGPCCSPLSGSPNGTYAVPRISSCNWSLTLASPVITGTEGCSLWTATGNVINIYPYSTWYKCDFVATGPGCGTGKTLMEAVPPASWDCATPLVLSVVNFGFVCYGTNTIAETVTLDFGP